LSQAHHIPPGQHHRDGLLLNGGGRAETGSLNSGGNALIERKLFKTH